MGEPLPVAEQRPRTRGDCVGGLRPCPWVGCKYHLALDVSKGGSISSLHTKGPGIKISRQGPAERIAAVRSFERRIMEVLERLPETCALDVAEQGGCTQATAAAHVGMERQIVNMLERRAMARARELCVDPRNEGLY